MQIVIIVAIDIAAFTAAFADRPEGDLPQTAQFAQQRRLFLAVALPQINQLTVRGFAQTFGFCQLAFEQRAVFRAGDRAFAFKQAGVSFTEALDVAVAAVRQFAGGKRRLLPPR